MYVYGTLFCFYVCCSDWVGICGNVCCVAAVVKYIVLIFSLGVLKYVCVVDVMVLKYVGSYLLI